MGAPIVEITLPASARFDEATRSTLERASGVVLVVGAPDRAGVVRIRLAALPAGAVHRLPLSFPWRASGRSRGLAVMAYDASEPRRIHVLEERVVEIAEER
jgi:hypothetical protein